MNSLNTERKERTASGKGRKVRHGSMGAREHGSTGARDQIGTVRDSNRGKAGRGNGASH